MTTGVLALQLELVFTFYTRPLGGQLWDEAVGHCRADTVVTVLRRWTGVTHCGCGWRHMTSNIPPSACFVSSSCDSDINRGTDEGGAPPLWVQTEMERQGRCFFFLNRAEWRRWRWEFYQTDAAQSGDRTCMYNTAVSWNTGSEIIKSKHVNVKWSILIYTVFHSMIRTFFFH